MTPFTLRMTIGAPTHLPLSKREVSDQIEMLIALLDKMDGDPDIERDVSDYEPSLGWSHTYAIAGSDDRELDEVTV